MRTLLSVAIGVSLKGKINGGERNGSVQVSVSGGEAHVLVQQSDASVLWLLALFLFAKDLLRSFLLLLTVMGGR